MNDIQALVQGGAVGLALVALGLVYYCLRLISNHLVEVAGLLARVSGSLDANSKEHKAIAKQLTRLNGKK